MNSEKEYQRKVKRFTPEEDSIIRMYCNKYSLKKAVKKLSAEMNRSERSIRERFNKFLNLNCNPFTEQEDQTILEKHAQYGNKWKLIASFLNSRSDIQTRIRFKQLKRESSCSEDPKPDDNHSDIFENTWYEDFNEFDFDDYSIDFL